MSSSLALDRQVPNFGMRWLTARLPRLSAVHPHLLMNFAARPFPFEFSDEQFHAAIHFGRPDWPGATHNLLFKEEKVAVCAPSRLIQQPTKSPEDVLAWPLLALANRRNASSGWFKNAGLDAPVPPPSASFEHFLMLAQAAAAGAGLALIPRFLIEPELSSGALIKPLAITVPSDDAYYFVTLATAMKSRAVENVRTWILGDAVIERNAAGLQTGLRTVQLILRCSTGSA